MKSPLPMLTQPRKFSDTVYFISVALFAICSIWFLMLPSNPLERLPGQDNGVFLYGGQQTLQGGVPYVSFWDHKGPLIYYINALGLFLGSGLRWGVWALEFAFLLLTALGLYKISFSQWGAFSSWVALSVWLYGMLKAGSYQHFYDSNYTETYGLLFNVWAMVFWLSAARSRPRLNYFLIGIMAGCSFLLRPNNIGTQAGIFIFQLFMGWRQKQVGKTLNLLVWLAAGALLTLGAAALWFWRLGALANLFDALILYNMAYSQKNLNPIRTLDVLAQSIFVFDWYLALIYIGLAAQIARLAYTQASGFLSKNSFALFLLTNMLLEIFLSALSGRFLRHYYIIWTPYLGLMAGAFVFYVFHAWRSRVLSQKYVYVVALILLLIWNASSMLAFTQTAKEGWQDDRKIESSSAVAEYLNLMTQPDETALVWGNEVWINVLSNRRSPTKYAYQYPLFMPGYTTRGKVDAFLQDLIRCPPAYIVEPIVDTDEILPLSQARREQFKERMSVPDGVEQVYAFFDNNYFFEREFNGTLVFARMKKNAPNPDCANR